MTTLKKEGIRMDHSSAHLMELAAYLIESKTIDSKFTQQVKGHGIRKAEDLLHDKQQHQQTDYDGKPGEVIKNYEEAILFDPTDEKVE